MKPAARIAAVIDILEVLYLDGVGTLQRQKSCVHHCSSGAMLDRVTETPSAVRFGKFNVGYLGYAGILKIVMLR